MCGKAGPRRKMDLRHQPWYLVDRRTISRTEPGTPGVVGTWCPTSMSSPGRLVLGAWSWAADPGLLILGCYQGQLFAELGFPPDLDGQSCPGAPLELPCNHTLSTLYR